MFLALYEDQLGMDPLEIWYPGISSCMSVTLYLSNRSMVGTHLTKFTPWNQVIRTFKVMKRMRGNRTVKRIYLIGRRSLWEDTAQGMETRWEALLELVAAKFHCYRIYSYDTVNVALTTDVRVMNIGESHLFIMVYKGGTKKLEGFPMEMGDDDDFNKIDVNRMGDKLVWTPNKTFTLMRRPYEHETGTGNGPMAHVTPDKLTNHG